MPDGVSVITRYKILRMTAPVQVDGAIGVRTAEIYDKEKFLIRHIHEFDAVWCEELPRSCGWFASTVRFELVSIPIGVECLCPRLERNIAESRAVRVLLCSLCVDIVRIDQ